MALFDKLQTDFCLYVCLSVRLMALSICLDGLQLRSENQKVCQMKSSARGRFFQVRQWKPETFFLSADQEELSSWLWCQPVWQAAEVEHTRPMSSLSWRPPWPVRRPRRSSPNCRGTASWADAVGTKSRRMLGVRPGPTSTTWTQSSPGHSWANSAYSQHHRHYHHHCHELSVHVM